MDIKNAEVTQRGNQFTLRQGNAKHHTSTTSIKARLGKLLDRTNISEDDRTAIRVALHTMEEEDEHTE